ncbi:DUF4384 domain-containing protein [Thiotrichales bacterium HSG1]|nr:DUF4384 domain-containing protein [Thiotrichales bacterium HSG1]
MKTLITLITIFTLFLTINPAQADEKQRGPKSKLNNDESKTSSVINPLDFKINYVYRPDGKGNFKDFGKNSILNSGDHYKLIFEPSENGYVYIFQIDSSNEIFRLFPTTDFKGADPNNINTVSKGQKYFIPAEHWSFKLNKTTGKETIYFVVTSQPDTNLEKYYKTMLAEQKNRSISNKSTTRKKWHNTMKQRGPEMKLVNDMTQPPTIWTEDNKQHSAEKSTYLKDMCDGCVYIVEFKHH